jgi:hypothetical protein
MSFKIQRCGGDVQIEVGSELEDDFVDDMLVGRRYTGRRACGGYGKGVKFTMVAANFPRWLKDLKAAAARKSPVKGKMLVYGSYVVEARKVLRAAAQAGF